MKYGPPLSAALREQTVRAESKMMPSAQTLLEGVSFTAFSEGIAIPRLFQPNPQTIRLCGAHALALRSWVLRNRAAFSGCVRVRPRDLHAFPERLC